MKTEELITDKAIDIAWGNADFGDSSKRDVIADTLLKYACGYHTGHTATCIVQELGLVSYGKLTALGSEYLCAHYSKFKEDNNERP